MDRLFVSPLAFLSTVTPLRKKNLRLSSPAEITFIDYKTNTKSTFDVGFSNSSSFQLSEFPAGEVVFSNLRSFCEGKKDSDPVFSLMVVFPSISVTSETLLLAGNERNLARFLLFHVCHLRVLHAAVGILGIPPPALAHTGR